MNHRPFQPAAAAANALLIGNALAGPASKRLPQSPEVPTTFAELDYRNVEAAAPVGMVVQATTPPEVVAALNKRVVAAINAPGVHKDLIDFHVEPVGDTPAPSSPICSRARQRAGTSSFST